MRDSDTEQRRDVIDHLEHALDQWRPRIDELIVKGDLASKGARDEMQKQMHTAENAYLAARSKLAAGRDDVGEDLSALRSDIEHLLDDVKRAFERAQRAVTGVIDR